MTMTSRPPVAPPGEAPLRPRIKPLHQVLGAVLVVVILGAGWMMLKPAASAPTAKTGVAIGKPPHVSQAATFATEGASVCATLNAHTAKLGDYPHGAKAQAVYLRRVLAYQSAAIKGIRALPAPPAAKAKLAAVYAQHAALDKVGLQAVKYLRAGNTKAAAPLLIKVNTRSTKVSAAYVAAGLPTCGS